MAACSDTRPAMIEATDESVVIRDSENADRRTMQEKADQVCRVHEKRAVYLGESCAPSWCQARLYSYACQ